MENKELYPKKKDMSDAELHQWREFRAHLATLKIRFLNAELQKELNENKGNVSSYISGKLVPSKNFLDKFYARYPVPKTSTEPIIPPIYKALIDELRAKDAEMKKSLEEDKKYFQGIVKDYLDKASINLSGLMNGQFLLQAQARAAIGLGVESAAKGDKKKANELNDRIRKQIVEDFEAGVKSGIPGGDGK